MVQERKEGDPQPQRKRIIFEYDNGTLSYIEGKDVEEYSRVEAGITGMSLIHGGLGWPELNWKRINVSEASKLFTE